MHAAGNATQQAVAPAACAFCASSGVSSIACTARVLQASTPARALTHTHTLSYPCPAAAHCAIDLQSGGPNQLTFQPVARVGAWKRNHDSQDWEQRPVVRTLAHPGFVTGPGYRNEWMNSDVALLLLQRPVTNKRPIKLAPYTRGCGWARGPSRPGLAGGACRASMLMGGWRRQ